VSCGGDRCCSGNYRKRLAATTPSQSIRAASSEAPPAVHSLTRVPSYCDGGGGGDPARVSFPAATAAVLSAVRLVFVAQRHLLCL